MEIIDLSFILLLVSTISILFILFFALRKKPLAQMNISLSSVLVCILILNIGVLVQNLCTKYFQMDPVPFENIIYIGTCSLPVSLFFTSLIFTKTKIKFKKRYILLFIIPLLTIIMVWTNNYHHLFYKNYSTNLNEMSYGFYFYIHTIYSYGLLFISMIMMLLGSKKNSGFFSKQFMLILIGTIIPIIINLLGFLRIINITVFVTPISFTVAMLFFSVAIFKFNFLSVAPIAIQTVVDKMSDGYVVLSEDNSIADFNKTFIGIFKLSENTIRKYRINSLLEKIDIDNTSSKKILLGIEQAKTKNKTLVYENYFKSVDKYFNIEITPIFSDSMFLGTLILLKDITQHKRDIQTIKDTQDSLMESERLSSLGQLIGGIAHNLKTPIMSIAGAAEGLTDLVKEYDESIDDPTVNSKDHHEIAADMSKWINKIKEYSEYMSDVITAVKGQAVVMANEDDITFTVSELIKRINILMKHELKNAIINLNISCNVDENLSIHGDVNNLVQVINNMISNAIQAYNGKTEESIEFIIGIQGNNVVFSIEDHAGGLPDKVKDKLFKEMITTKGKNGTGLGLYMSYSTIKAHFNGNISFETEKGKGTRFDIAIPVN